MKRRFYSLVQEVRNRHVFGFDAIMFCCTPAVALLLRFDSLEEAAVYLQPLFIYTLTSLVWKLGIFFPAGLYNRYWRYASVDELATVIGATIATMALGVILFFSVLRPSGLIQPDFPRSVPIIDGLLTAVAVGGFRFLLRLGFEHADEAGNDSMVLKPKKRTLIVGAGVAGSMILRELRMNPQLPIEPVGFLDDDLRKLGARINGVQVVGPLKDLPAVVKRLNVQEVLIAMPTASGKTIRDVVQMCKQAKVVSKTIPGIFEILDGSAKVSQIRDVQIEDLLRRGVVKTDTAGVAQMLMGARVMVTGAGGSIGAELCRQISTIRPKEMILLGHGENSIFQIAGELRKLPAVESSSMQITTVIADVRDRDRMKQVFATLAPEIVFHAAAHKHVGLMEENIPDAITNNVLGTQILVELADQYRVQRFLMISSDKAVNPTCIMGVTKRIAELLVHDAAERTGRPFVSVRFGNVLGSRGSVIPIFRQQIAAGGPVQVTHPDAKRYFMTIPEAVQLVLQAATMGEGGEVFVLDMGEPIRILDLARDLIKLSGYEEGKDIDIEFTGLHKGEKVTEELFFAAERVERSVHEKILVCRNGFSPSGEGEAEKNGALPPQVTFINTNFKALVNKLIHQAHTGSASAINQTLRVLVPEYAGEETIAQRKVSGQDVLPLGIHSVVHEPIETLDHRG
jgi:FlaA1/EpsC-like NDP-sugar epimerase